MHHLLVTVVHCIFLRFTCFDVKNIVFFLGRSIAFVLENRADLDEMPYDVAVLLGLYCFPK